MTDDPKPSPHSSYLPFWTDFESVDLSETVHVEAIASMNGHDHIELLEGVAEKLLPVWTQVHLQALLRGVDCSSIPHHDEVEAEMKRVAGFIDRAQSGVWN